MWRYIAGVKRSAEKTSQEEPVDKEAKVKKHFFKERWRKADNGESRDWLVYDETSLTMFCSVCRQHASENAKTNSFIVGTKNLKLEAIKDHESSKCHIQVKKRAQGKAAPENTAAMKALTSLKTAQLDKMIILFRNAHAIAKKGRPFQDYEWQC
ncbi:hypothetical protein ABG768_025722, partial [Culter alburnus]